ncbi:MAG: pYEATS domain-containing protein, partial [Sphingomonadaceae bacterium]
AREMASRGLLVASSHRTEVATGLVQPGEVPDDPWKGQFGSRQANALYRLDGKILPEPNEMGLYAVEIVGRPQDSANRAEFANREGLIYLHPTFPEFIRPVMLDANGEFRLSLLAFGGFTVGLQLPAAGAHVEQLLELDLAELPDAPEAFRSL